MGTEVYIVPEPDIQGFAVFNRAKVKSISKNNNLLLSNFHLEEIQATFKILTRVLSESVKDEVIVCIK